MHTTPPAVQAETVFDVLGPGGVRTPIAIELRYSSKDPFAVTMRFFVRRDECVTWLVSRSLFAEGLDTACGLGDVRFQPADPGFCVIELRSEQGDARFHAPTDVLRRFLDSTCELVPDGQESAWFDIDAEIGRLADNEDW